MHILYPLMFHSSITFTAKLDFAQITFTAKDWSIMRHINMPSFLKKYLNIFKLWKSKTSQYLWKVDFVNNKTLIKERSTALRKIVLSGHKLFHKKKMTSICDSYGMNLNYISEVIITNRDFFIRKLDEFYAHGKLLLCTKQNFHPREKPFEYDKNGKAVLIQTLKQLFEYNECGKAFHEGATFITYKNMFMGEAL
ncbi:unnamed protein product [Nyctereutes procyonoides]|uniref:(raccoon dog) hypothetical protein n=1 Tax=Nyctereutes procyonoides TaxID=34880 RepID=A0A811ZC04_NYCPR|nr:unnamed protein product [Nyctereutes procyonoides]